MKSTPIKKILLVGAECVPFAKTGGLADVLGTLPQELINLNIDARVILPFHQIIKDKYKLDTQHVADFYIQLGWRSQYVGVEKLVKNSVTYYFIDNEDYYGDKIYRSGVAEIEQYAFFCRAVIEAVLRIDFIPDVLHLNDWQTGLIPILLKTQYNNTLLDSIKTLFTIHNVMYQGMCGFEQMNDLLDIPYYYNTPEFVESNGCANFMKAGLVFSDKINTVSETYAQELKLPEFSYGLEGILNARSNHLVGILNGIDINDYNPQTDSHIPYNFSLKTIKLKKKNKQDLMSRLALEYDDTIPLIGIVSRLTSQKGFDLLAEAFEEMMQENVSVVLLGTGDSYYEDFFRKCENTYKGRVCAYIGYDNHLAHEIYAASDLFLMPSRFEPCGISQMISLQYGTLPIVRETGGLKDTIIPFNEFNGTGNGFTFTSYNAYDMLSVIKYALSCVTDDKKCMTLIKNAMQCDNSFKSSAKKYAELYNNL